MRRRFIQIDGELVEVGVYSGQPKASPTIMPDIKPYRSMITGELITSRSRHREHLKAHGAVEVGNDKTVLNAKVKPIPDAAPQQRKEIIRSQIDAMRHDEFRRAIKRDVDRVKWNSRED